MIQIYNIQKQFFDIIVKNHNDLNDVNDVINQNELIIEFSQTSRINQKLQKKTMMIRENFVNKSINEDFTVNQN